jgi:hypothetical protein
MAGKKKVRHCWFLSEKPAVPLFNCKPWPSSSSAPRIHSHRINHLPRNGQIEHPFPDRGEQGFPCFATIGGAENAFWMAAEEVFVNMYDGGNEWVNFSE